MSDLPVKTERAGNVTTVSPKYSELADDTAIVCGAQTWCEHGNTRIEQLADGPHYAKEVCCDCGGVLRWLPKPATVTRNRLNGYRIARLAMCDRLTHWERNFIRGLPPRTKLSPRQQAIIDRLVETYLK
jgi:hypothetical protein